jgi:hypothetical protein
VTFSCARLLGASASADRKQKIQELEARPPSAEALERKARSIEFLTGKGVPTIQHLPVIEDSQTARLRSPREIAERTVACTIAAVAGESGDKQLAAELVRDFKASSLLSPKEREFLASGITDKTARIQFSWRYERVWVLLWALGYVDQLRYPDTICDVPRLVTLVKGKTVASLLAGAKPRPFAEVLDAADFIYRLDWAVVNARVKKTKPPVGIDGGVVLERHAALNWLIGYMGQSWDDIATDT